MQPGYYPLSIDRGIIFGPYQFQLFDANNAAVPLTGCTVYAWVKDEPGGNFVLDLQPVIIDSLNGIIELPEILDGDTINLDELDGQWDIIVQKPTGERTGPYITGTFTISSICTEPPE